MAKARRHRMKRIPVGHGLFAQVSDCDYAFLSQFAWHCRRKDTRSGPVYYAVSNQWVGGKKRYAHLAMHRVVAERAGLNITKRIDHRDRKTLNNTRRNLRTATPLQSNANRKGWSRSGFKGVTLLPSGKWRARMRHKHLGVFATRLEAHRAYLKSSRKHFGAFASP